MTDSQTQPTPARGTQVLQFVRALFHLMSAIIIVIWAFLAWEFPFPSILAGLGFLLLVVLIWALFLSPRPVLRTDRFGQALIELLLLAGAVGALLDFGWFWVWPALFGIAGAVVGYLASTRSK